MTAANLKLVTNDTDAELENIQREIDAKQKTDAMLKTGGPSAADILPPDEELTYDDLTNAKRFLAMTGDDVLYSAEAKKWLIWNKTHWAFDNTNLVFELSAAFVRDLYSPAEINRNPKESWKHAIRSNNRSGLNAMIELSQKMRTTELKELDSQPFLLNCLNGTLDLKTGELKPHDRADKLTRVVNADYDSTATSKTFDDFLATIQPDPDVRAFLQRSIGYSLLGVVRERSFWILYGSGNNGKSVFVNLFDNLLGDYSSATTTASVMAGKQSAIPNDIARLKGKRFVIIPETEENERLNSALVKALSAGDTVTARFLFGEFFDFAFTGKLWIATNHKPAITDHSKGMWDRMKLVPFNQDIPKDKIVKADDLMAQLLADAPAILNWAVTGCRDYLDLDSLEVPDVIQAEITKYKFEQDSIAQFIEECCTTLEQARNRVSEDYIIAGDFHVTNADLYKAYKQFCIENGEYQLKHKKLTQNMTERGFNQRNSGGRFWEGIRLSNPNR